MTPDDFIRKWRSVELKERSAAQSHFNDLCLLLEEKNPVEADPKGEWYCFERGATKTTGGEGWADVWKRHHFGWEYKGKRKDLTAAFAQLQQYALALENPPLLVVSDMDRFEVHTNWTNSVSKVHQFSLDDLRDGAVRDVLKAVFSDPKKLDPGQSRQELTQDAAAEFAGLALRLREKGNPPGAVAHFVNRLVFCMFAEDIGLLPNKMFARMLDSARERPEEFQAQAALLFRAMREGGKVGFERVEWFNGGLFDDDSALSLDKWEIESVIRAAALDWAEIDPSILGTLFERGLDPDKRSQLGAHYTDRDKIMQIIEPVVREPLLSQWDAARAQIAEWLSKSDAARLARNAGGQTRAHKRAVEIYKQFLERLRNFTVLDPACGSGNFLYLALKELKDLEHRCMIEAEAMGLQREFPHIGPSAVKGIEINAYAAELARVTVWIGEIQWMRRNGFNVTRDPILRPLETIECRDAILNADGTEADWPVASVIVGNPPFLGDKKMAGLLGREYVSRLRSTFKGRVSGGADLVTFWFEKAGKHLAAGKADRFGLVSTNGIRFGKNREVLESILARGLEVFSAVSDDEWTVDGAAVRVSLVCVGRGNELASIQRTLDGIAVPTIYADLTGGAGKVDVTAASPLPENKRQSFFGFCLAGAFGLSGDEARAMLSLPLNTNGRNNSDVVRPLWNGIDVLRRHKDRWVVDFGATMSEEEAAHYEKPFEFVRMHVLPKRKTNNRPTRRLNW